MHNERDKQPVPPSPLPSDETATMPLKNAPALPLAPAAPSPQPPLLHETITALWTDKIATGASPQATIKGKCLGSLTAFMPPQRRIAPPATEMPDCDYRLIQRLGEGGMGTVFLARQISVDRLVALKFLRGDAAQHAEYLSNFLIEGMVMGNLDHPNIVPIYDLGVDAQNGFFIAMKYVQGTPWSQALDNLSLAENLNILRRVADAAAFAHSKGVLHLDLKPGNVMLGEFGEVLVTDWGVAASFTQQGKARPLAEMALLGGPPAYMPPEMARMEIAAIDVRADVYLLGAILFEILVGQPPHPGADLQEALLHAAQNLLAAPLPANDLGAIAGKALASRPADRYASVREFQTALRAYEEHFQSNVLSAAAQEDLICAEKSEAYDDYAKALYGFHHALKLWPQNTAAADGLARARLSYAACAFRRGDFDLALSQLDPNDERHRALAEKIKESQRARAAMAEAKARAEAQAREESERAKRINEFLRTTLASANPAKFGRHITVLELMDQTSRTVDERFGHDPKVCADIHLTLGQTYESLGSLGQAISHLQKTMAQREQIYGRCSTEYLEAYHALAIAYISQRQGEKAEAAMREIMALYESLPSPPEEMRHHYNVALGSALMVQKRYAEAGACYCQARDAFMRLRGEDDSSYIAVTANLAAALAEQGKPTEAEPMLREVRAAALRLYGPKHPNAIRASHNLAYFLSVQKRYEEALPLYEEVKTAKEKVLGPEHPDTLRCIDCLATCLKEIGKEGESLALRRRLVDISRRCLGSEHRDTAIYLNNLAGLLIEAKDPLYRNAAEALPLAEEAVRLSEGKDYRYLATFAAVLYENRRFAEAVAMQEKVLRLLKEHPTAPRREAEENLKKYHDALAGAGDAT